VLAASAIRDRALRRGLPGKVALSKRRREKERGTRVAYPLIPRSRAAEDFASLVDRSRYAQAQSPVPRQPLRYEDILSAVPMRFEGPLATPTVVGKVPLGRDALLRLTGRPMGENPLGFAELLGRF